MAEITSETINRFLLSADSLDHSELMLCLQKVAIHKKGIKATDKQGVINVIYNHIKKQFTKEKLPGVMFMLGFDTDKHTMEVHLYEKKDEVKAKKLLGYTYGEL